MKTKVFAKENSQSGGAAQSKTQKVPPAAAGGGRLPWSHRNAHRGLVVVNKALAGLRVGSMTQTPSPGALNRNLAS